MSTQYKIWMALIITILCVLAAVWQVSNIKGIRSRGRRRMNSREEAKNRSSDKRKLSSLEKKMLAEAHRMLTKGKIAPGARILEQLGMYREAVQSLEENGFIHEAAKMLMRMQRHNRAGVIYARHGMWEHAAQCFRVANLPLEVAKCAKEAGDHLMAAEYFEKAERFEEAADFHYISGSMRKAAELFLRGEVYLKAIVAYNKIGIEEKNLATVKFFIHELDFICSSLEKSEVLNSDHEGLVNILLTTDRVLPVLRKMIELGYIDQSKSIYLKSTIDLGPQILSEINYQNSNAEHYANMFLQAKAFNYAGIAYEKMNSFSQAGECFEKAEDLDRAIYCFERGGISLKVSFLKAKKRGTRPKKEASLQSSFVLTDTDPFSEYPGHPAGKGKPTENQPSEDLKIFAEQNTKILPFNPLDRQDSNQISGDNSNSPGFFPPPMNQNLEKSDLLDKHDHRSIPPREALSTDSTSDKLAAYHQRSSDQLVSFDLGIESDGLDNAQLKSIFLQSKFLGDLENPQKEMLWHLGKLHHFSAGEKILSSNEEPLGLYIIVRGATHGFKFQSGTEVLVDQMKETDSFGELWLLTDTPNSMNFVSMVPSTLHIIDRLTFNQFLDRDGTVARKLYKRFTSRLLKRLVTSQNDGTFKSA